MSKRPTIASRGSAVAGVALLVVLSGGYAASRSAAGPAAASAPAADAAPEAQTRRAAVGLLLVQGPGELPEPGRPVVMPGPEESGVLQTTYATMLAHDSVFLEAVSNPASRIRATAWFKRFESDPDPMAARRKDLAANLTVSPVPKSRLIRVTMSAPIGEDAQAIVNELGDVLVRQAEDARKNVDRRQVELMTKESKLLRNELDTEVAVQLQAKERELGASGIDPAGAYNEKRALYQALLQADNQSRQWAAGAAALAQELDVAQRDGRVPADVRAAAERDPRYVAARRRADDADARVGELELAGGKDRGDVEAARKLRSLYQQKADDIREQLEARELQARRAEAQTKVLTLNASRTVSAEAIAKVGEELGRMAETSARYDALRKREQRLGARIETLYEDIRRIREFRLAVPWGPVQWASRPTVQP